MFCFSRHFPDFPTYHKIPDFFPISRPGGDPVSETQFGFTTDKGTRNAIFFLRTLMERAIDLRKDLSLCFIDYSKAFDKVKHSDLFDILLRHNCDGKDLRVVRNLYWVQEATIRIGDDCSVYRPMCRGVRQGCVFSPDLFNTYSGMILQNIKHHEGVRVGGNMINYLRYADDKVLIADSVKNCKIFLQQSQSKVKTKDFNWMQRRLSAWSSQNSQTFLYATFFAKGEKSKTSRHL